MNLYYVHKRAIFTLIGRAVAKMQKRAQVSGDPGWPCL